MFAFKNNQDPRELKSHCAENEEISFKRHLVRHEYCKGLMTLAARSPRPFYTPRKMVGKTLTSPITGSGKVKIALI